MHSLNFRLSSDIVESNITESDILPDIFSFEELTIINDINKDFDHIDRLFVSLTSLESIKKVIVRDGVTDAFYNTVNDTLLDNLQLDLTPYIKKEGAECTMALESIGSAIADIYHAIIDFFKRIGRWFANLFSMWLSKHERYKHRINKLNRTLTQRLSKVDTNAFSKTAVSGYPYVTYVKMFNAITNMMGTLRTVDYGALESLNIRHSFGQDLISCGYAFDESGSMIAPVSTAFITLPAQRMGWTPSRVWDYSQSIPKKLLGDITYISTQERDLQRSIDGIVREIERGIAGNTKLDLVVLRKRKAGAMCLKHITQYILSTSAGMARQYINMCDSFKYT